MLGIQSIQRALKPSRGRCNKAVQKPDPLAQMKIPVPGEGISRVSAFNMGEIHVCEVPENLALLLCIAAAAQQFKHRNHRTGDSAPLFSAPPEIHGSWCSPGDADQNI